MKNISLFNTVFLSLLLILSGGCKKESPGKISITDNLSVIQGDVNLVSLKSGKHRLVVYGAPENVKTADLVLFTDARRDVVWAGRELVKHGAKAVVPQGEAFYFANTDSVWKEIVKNQFHDYREKTSCVPVEPMPVYKKVKEGDTINWRGFRIDVVNSRGFTEGAVSYILNVDGKKIAFVGNMIYGDGKILDLYSMQEKVPELDLWGYHGFAVRMADLIENLEKIKSLKPDILIPARGPVINDPDAAIDTLIKRLWLVYQNYLAINSLRWYKHAGWGNPADGKENLAARVLPDSMPVEWLPFAETRKNHKWLKTIVNSRLIISDDNTAFLIDCGLKPSFEKYSDIQKNFSVSGIEGIFITHYHDDHTDYINKIREMYDVPVYITKELKDILNNPEAYKLPAMTSEKITGLTVMPEGSDLNWKEFTFTFRYFPGQTIYHNAIFVKNNKTGEILFITGDSFSPAGVDDYCLQNRNLYGDSLGYEYCLDVLKQLPDSCWLVSMHVPDEFKFGKEQIDMMRANLKKREKLMKELFPWDNPNYGIDPRWVRVKPYRQKLTAGQDQAVFDVIIYNHSNVKKDFTVIPNTGDWGCTPEKQVVSIPAGKEGKVTFKTEIPVVEEHGTKIVTVNVSFDKWNLHEWSESIIEF